ncbi:MAG: 50S ribosomal protein L17 [bacterium]
MRHQCKRHLLGRPKDQRDALLRSLATALFTYDEIQTTMAKAKALRIYADKIVTLAKRGDVHARRQAVNFIYDNSVAGSVCVACNTYNEQSVEEAKCECGGKLVEATVLRKLFSVVAKNAQERQGGYTRVYRMPPRRGDNTEMALIQLS